MMPIYQVDYVLRQEGFDQIEADSEEEAIRLVAEGLTTGDIESIEAFELDEGFSVC